jgi:hypothetical protein
VPSALEPLFAPNPINLLGEKSQSNTRKMLAQGACTFRNRKLNKRVSELRKLASMAPFFLVADTNYLSSGSSEFNYYSARRQHLASATPERRDLSGRCIKHVGQSLAREQIIASLPPLECCNGCCKPFKAVHLRHSFWPRFFPRCRLKSAEQLPSNQASQSACRGQKD